jgi:hypothetical protein
LFAEYSEVSQKAIDGKKSAFLGGKKINLAKFAILRRKLNIFAIFSALMFNFERLPGTIYVSTAIFGIFRYSANVTMGALDYFVKAAGRRIIHTGALAYILFMLLIILLSKWFGKLNRRII